MPSLYTGQIAGMQYGDTLRREREAKNMAYQNMLNQRSQAMPVGSMGGGSPMSAPKKEAMPTEQPKISREHNDLMSYIKGVALGNPRMAEKGFSMVKPDSTVYNQDGSISAVSTEGYPIKFTKEQVDAVTTGNRRSETPAEQETRDLRNEALRVATEAKRNEYKYNTEKESAKARALRDKAIITAQKQANEIEKGFNSADIALEKKRLQRDADVEALKQATIKADKTKMKQYGDAIRIADREIAEYELNRKASQESYAKLQERINKYSAMNDDEDAGVPSNEAPKQALPTQPSQDGQPVETVTMEFPDGKRKVVPASEVTAWSKYGKIVD